MHHPRSLVTWLASATLIVSSCAHASPPPPVTWKQIAAQPMPAAGHRIAYGPDSLQFGELRIPEGPGPFPVAVVIHGGCWRSEYDLQHVLPVSDALVRHGIATWTIEYRRIGNEGGGWPGTFLDVAHATDHLRELANTYPLDLDRVIALGHSAGGHLALWLATRGGLPAAAEIATADPLPIHGVVGLAAIGDLDAYAKGTSWCCQSAPLLLGGAPEAEPGRYALASPIGHLPLRIPVRLVQGAADEIVPIAQSRAWVTRARAAGDDVRLAEVPGAGHFDVISLSAPAWPEVEKAALELTHPTKPRSHP